MTHIDNATSELIPNSHSPVTGGWPKRKVIMELSEQDKFDPILFQKALNIMSEGYSTLDAAKAIGVHRVTLYRWKDRDEVLLQMWTEAQERCAASRMDLAGIAGERLCSDEVLDIAEPKRANAWVQAQAQGARTLVEVAKRMAPRLYGDRIEHTGSQTQVAFVVSVAPTATVQAQLEGPEADAQSITIQPLERSAPTRPGRQGKVKVRQPTPKPKQRKTRKSSPV